MSTNLTEIGTQLLKEWCSTLPTAVTLCFVPPAPWIEENKEAKEREGSLVTSTVVKKTLNWFCARLFLSISSVSTKQWQTCAENYPKILRFQRNLMQTNIWKRWKFLQNFLLLILTPTQSCRETCCKIMSKNSNNFLKIRNYPNCVATRIHWLLKKDNSSPNLMKKKDPMKWRIYVESIHCFEVKKHPEREGGFSETRKSTWSWMWRSVFIKDVTVLKSWSNLCFETEQFLGFELWTELPNM